MGPNKIVHLMFAVGALAGGLPAVQDGRLGVELLRQARTSWSINGVAPAGRRRGAALVAYRNERVFAAGHRGDARAGEGHLADPQGDQRGDHRRHRDGGRSPPLILTAFDCVWSLLANWILR